MPGRRYERDRRGLILPGLAMLAGLAVLGVAMLPLPTHGSPSPQTTAATQAPDGAPGSSQTGRPQQLRLGDPAVETAATGASDGSEAHDAQSTGAPGAGPTATPQSQILAAVPDDALPVTQLAPITGSGTRSRPQSSSQPVNLQVALVAESPDLNDVAKQVASLVRNDRVTASVSSLDKLERPDVVLLLGDTSGGASVWFCSPSTNASQQLAASMLKAIAPLPSEPDSLDVSEALPCDTLYTGRAQVAAALVRLPAATSSFDAPRALAGAVNAYLSANAASIQNNRSAGRLIWPAYGPITSYYGPSHPLGIDIGQSTGDIVAAMSGTVTFAGGDPCCSYGNYVIIDNPAGIETLYAHFSQLYVKQGEKVQGGDPLGHVGCTGHCTGNHLHFETIVNGVRVDPMTLLP